jgi:hypothetical protein
MSMSMPFSRSMTRSASISSAFIAIVSVPFVRWGRRRPS